MSIERQAPRPEPAALSAVLEAQGWEQQQDVGFMALIGPVWQRSEADGPAFALMAEARHRNRFGIVHGGVLMAFADRAMGGTARALDPEQRHATVALDMHFTEAAAIGDLLEARCRIVRRTRSLAFLDGTLTSGTRVLATAKGIWKLFGPAKPPRGQHPAEA